jgi:hypothetical protein
LPAQEFRATLTGRVTDASGAAVPNVPIVAVNTATNAHSDTKSGADGFYTVPFLPPGPYAIHAEAPGFKKYVHEAIKIESGENVTEDIQLQLGDTKESVEVKADAELVDRASATSGQVITSTEVENLPINGRSPIAVAREAYGVVPKEKHSVTEVRPFDNSGAGDFSLGGANSNSNEYLLDGVPNMENASRTSGFSPQADSVEAVRVDQFESDAAYGDTLGGTVLLTTKSGTNQFHGTASEFNQTSALAANQFFNNINGTPKTVTRQNDFGGTFGGPVWIPKIYNGKNKLFFFFAAEGFKDSTPTSKYYAVPTQAERNGDFSALIAATASDQLYNPYSAVSTNGKTTRTAFPGNVIPTSLLNPVALAYLKFYPLPNAPGKADGENNFYSTAPTIDNYSSYSGRLDYNISDRNKLFVSVHDSYYTNGQANIFNNISTGQFSNADILSGVLDDVHVFSPTTVLDFRLGYNRTYTNSSIASDGFDPTTLGFPSYLGQNSTLIAMPRISLSDSNDAGLSTTPGSISPFDQYQIFTTLTKVKNAHSFKVGADLRMEKTSAIGGGYSAGTFTFGNNWVTSGTGGVAQPFGSSFASFLLGLPTAGQFDIVTPATYSNKYFGFFVQDDWHVTPNLTVNLGVRLEHETAVVESNNKMVVGFNPSAANAVSSAAQTAFNNNLATYNKLLATSPIPVPGANFLSTGGFQFATPSQRSGYTTPANFWSPRVGASWSPRIARNKTVFRGGFGLYNNPFGDYASGPSYGFSQTTSFVPTTNNYLTPAATLSNPFPSSNSIQQPTGAGNGINTYLGNSSALSYYNPHFADPYSIRWSFDIQQDLGRNFLLDIGYIGNHQVHQTTTNQASALPLQYLTTSNNRNAALTTLLGTSVPNPYAGLLPGTAINGPTIALASLLNPYSEFPGGVTVSDLSQGYGWFDMLAVRLSKRFSDNLQFNVNFEHSRLLETTGQLTPGGPQYYGVPSGDFPNHLSITGSYYLPFGRGQRFLGNSNRLVDAIVGGWVANAVYTWESGAAVSWGNVIYSGGNLNWNTGNIASAFDVTQFDRNANDQPNAYNYRTFPTMFNNLRSDPTNNADLSLLKNFHLTESVLLQYRFEAFNALNYVQFAAPNVSPTSSAFGTVTGTANTARVIQMGLRLSF